MMEGAQWCKNVMLYASMYSGDIESQTVFINKSDPRAIIRQPSKYLQPWHCSSHFRSCADLISYFIHSKRKSVFEELHA